MCGALKDTPGLGFHWGFGAAGVGMVLGLLVYLFGLPFIKELPEDVVYHDPDAKPEDEAAGGKDHVMTEDEAETTPSVIPSFASLSPSIFLVIGILSIIGGPLSALSGMISMDNAVAIAIAGGSSVFAAWILSHLKMAVRDRVLAIYILSVFVIFFWAAFEQAGNAMNVWADQTTNRYLTADPKAPEIYPEVPIDLADLDFMATVNKAVSNLVEMNPIGTTSFQSINALAIVLFAPIFAWLWLYLARRHINVSIAMKMSLGVFFQGVAFALMLWAATYEGGPSQTNLSQLPPNVVEQDGGLVFYDAPELGDDERLTAILEGNAKTDEPMPAHGGRLVFNPSEGKLNMNGVLDANHRDRVLRATVSPSYLDFVYKMAKETETLKEEASKAESAMSEAEKDELKEKKKADKSIGAFEKRYTLDKLPEGFEPRYLQGFKTSQLEWNGETKTFIVRDLLADKDYKQILVAGADPDFRDALNDLYVSAAKYKVSSWWLVAFYVLCTIGELCLSPVGLSMVSKLAPRRFATMLMGMWLLTSFFGNFAAGLAGENWERLDPATYFTWITVVMIGASMVCFVIAKSVTRMMHGVK